MPSTIQNTNLGTADVFISSLNPDNRLYSAHLSALQIQLVDFIKQAGTRKKLKPGEVILSEGETCDFFFFVEKGIFRVYRWYNDKELTFGFTFQGDIDTCPWSFINNAPSLDIIESVTHSEIVKVNRKELDIMRKQNPACNDLIMVLLSNYIEVLVKRLLTSKALTAEEQYSQLLKRQPGEVSKIPLMYIASFLGVSQARLSRIRKKTSPFDLGQLGLKN